MAVQSAQEGTKLSPEPQKDFLPGANGTPTSGSSNTEGPTQDGQLNSDPSSTASKGRIRVRPWTLYRFATPVELVAVVIGIFFAFIMGGAMPLFAVFFGDATTSSFAPSVGGQSALEQMKPTLVKLGSLMAGMFVCGFIWQTLLSWAAERQAATMRMRYLERILAQDASWFDVNEAAALPSRMATEVLTISDAIGNKIGLMFMSGGQFIFGLVVAYIMEWKLALVISGTIPVFVLVGMYMATTIAEATDAQHTWFAKAGAVAEEVLMAIRTVSSFGGEHHELKRFSSNLGHAKRCGIKSGINLGLCMGIMFGAMSAMYSLAFWFGAYHLIAEGETPGNFMTVFFSVFIGVSSLQQLGDPLLAWSKAVSSASNMFAVLESSSTIEPETQSVQPDVAPLDAVERIDFKQVRFAYPCRPDVTVLKGIDLTIFKGQKVALVGESGSGKSTIIQLLERFYDASAGTVLVNGKPIGDLPVLQWRGLMGYVGQEPVLFATSVLDNIKGGDASITDEQVIDAAKKAQAFEFLNQLPHKLETFVGAGGGQMSGGQKQRIAIARALVKRPQILLLDEATSALDSESEKMVQNTIDSLQTSAIASETAMTTISIAHRLSTVKNADVIFVLKAGLVVEQGSHQELMAKAGEYFCLVQSQDSAEEKDQQAALSPSNAGPSRQVSGPSRQVSAGSRDAPHTPKSQDKLKTDKEVETAILKEIKDTGFKSPTRRLFGLMKPEWPIFVVAFVVALVAGGVMPANGRFLSGAMNSLYIPFLPGGSMEEMLDDMDKWILLFGLAALVSFVGELGKYGVFNYIQECLTLRLRGQAFGSLLCQEIGFFDDPRNGPGGLVSMLAKQTSLVSQSTGISLGNTVGSMLSIFVGLGLAFEGSWQLSLAVLGAVPIVGVSMAIIVKMMMPNANAETDDAYSASYQSATEAIVNIRTVRALVAEQHSVGLFSKSVEIVAKKEAGGCWKKGLAFGFGNAAMFVIYIIAFWYGSYLIDNGTPAQKIFQSLFCIMFGVMGAGMAAAFMPGAVQSQVAAFETFRIIDRESGINAMADPPQGQHCDLGDGSIVFENVSFHYPYRPELVVLQGLSLQIPRGSSAAFVGPSGCGKSTAIQLIQRFYDPASGHVKVGGVSLRDFNVAWWRRQVGFVGQEPVLFDISLEDNVKYGKPEATRAEIEAAGRVANMEYVENGLIKWEDSVGTRGGKLSGGQKQRCAIARALIRDPAVLILDEATSALDSASEHLVQQALDAAKKGRTTIAIAHRLSTIRDSDRIFVMKSGQVGESGTHDELMQAKGMYWNLAKRAAE